MLSFGLSPTTVVLQALNLFQLLLQEPMAKDLEVIPNIQERAV
uniref:Uncharacterized protein n=1 Tax=Arundo donax TaxID=35708 RepID=A0A0A8XYQ1_ARUDO